MSQELQRPVFRLLLNAREAFPYPSATTLTRDWDWRSNSLIAAAVNLLPEHEQTTVLRYYRCSDVALSLGSHLLKHLAIVRACGVRWAESHITVDRDTDNGRPYYAPGGLVFNVSHHGELVVLVGSTRPGAQVGIDVVKVDLERDGAAVAREGGFAAWSRMFRDAFSDGELACFAGADFPQMSGEQLLRERLRLFYAHWACKEAYVKMTGDALGADFLKILEFQDVRVPRPATHVESHETPGEVAVTQATMSGTVVEGTLIYIQAIGQDYMVATAIQGEDFVSGFHKVDLLREVLSHAST